MTKKQVESGFKLNTSFNHPTFVFANLWPSWAFAARAAGYSPTIVHVEDEKPGVMTMVRAGLSSGSQCVDLGRWKTILVETVSNIKVPVVLVLLQGPREALNRILGWISGIDNVTARLDILVFATSELDARRRVEKKRKLLPIMGVEPIAGLSHQSVGGVLDHTWTLESNVAKLVEQRDRLSKYCKVQASLQDYLSHTEDGKVRRPPTSEEVATVGTNVLWKRKTWHTVARSVFATTGWVKRNLTNDELLDVYDVSVGDRKVMFQALKDKGIVKLPLEFTQQLPVRVLLRSLNVLSEEYERDVKGDREVVQQLGVNGQEVGPMYDISRMEQLLLTQEDKKTQCLASEGVSERDKQQSKNDDAVAEVSNWNRRVCDRLGVVYVPEIHVKALDGFRKLQLFWYRHYKHGVMGSFQKYMHGKYGIDWLKQVQKEHAYKRNQAFDNLEIVKDYKVGMDAISRALQASFWEWDDGSTILFWRWPDDHQKELRDGLKVWFRRKDLPSFWGRQKWPDDITQREQLKDKLSKVVKR